MIITIDGPVASGKSTLAKELAKKLNFYYLYSGYLYRSLGYLLHKHQNYTAETVEYASKADVDKYLDPNRFVYKYSAQDGVNIFFDELEITPFLKEPLVDRLSSYVSRNLYVRDSIVDMQRHLASQQTTVLEGRDGGSIVFPYADYKFFLTARPEIRAQRWRDMQRKKGNEFSLEKSLYRISERDASDMHRKHSPMVIPKNSIVVDNSDFTQEETLHHILKLLESR
jgi:cytidylate kinase